MRVGATTTHAEIEHDTGLRAVCPLLPDTARHVADPLIRNRGTLGGSLAAADPRGDWPMVALALGATSICTRHEDTAPSRPTGSSSEHAGPPCAAMRSCTPSSCPPPDPTPWPPTSAAPIRHPDTR